MKHRLFSVAAPMAALCLMMSVASVSKADTFNRATSSGRFYMDGNNLTAINVNANQSYSDLTGVTTSYGTMSIVSNTLALSTVPDHQEYYRVNINGKDYPHAVITSKPFNFYANIYHISFRAHVVVELTQFGPNGRGSFKLIRDSDNAVIAQSSSTSSVESTDVPFISGNVSITL